MIYKLPQAPIDAPASFTNIFYKAYDQNTKGVYAFSALPTHAPAEMRTASGTFSYYGGELWTESEETLGNNGLAGRASALYVFGGSLVRTYADTFWRGTDIDPVGVTRGRGMHFPRTGLSSKTAVRMMNAQDTSMCVTAAEAGAVEMKPCVGRSNTQLWWREYHPVADGNFLLKYLCAAAAALDRRGCRPSRFSLARAESRQQDASPGVC